MKISRSRYEKAKQMVKKMAFYQKTVEAWEEAMRRVGDVGDQTVVAIEITADGKIKIECETPLLQFVESEGA